MTSLRRRAERGSAVLLALMILATVSAIAVAAAASAMLGQKAVQHGFYREKAYCIAESGVEKAIVEIAADAQFAGENEVPFDVGSFSTTVRALGENETEITSVGQAQKGRSMLYRCRIVARVRLDADQARVVGWSVSSLPTERIRRNDEFLADRPSR
jgi:hypothetical protein